MRTLIARVVIAAALVAAAVMARAEARQLRAEADTLERLATLRVDISEEAGAAQRAAAEYWRGAYQRLSGTLETADGKSEPQVLLMAANAAFRAAERTVQTRVARLQQLDAVVQGYASALKAPLFMPDAAFNYEYVVRLRDALARARGATPPPGPKQAAVTPSADLPSGATIHGRPGGPPPDTKGDEFDILTPMEYGDRETQPEPTSGVKPLRKG